MDLEGSMLSKTGKTEKDKYCITSLTSGISKCQIKKKKKSRIVVARGWGRENGEILIKGHKHLAIR